MKPLNVCRVVLLAFFVTGNPAKAADPLPKELVPSPQIIYPLGPNALVKAPSGFTRIQGENRDLFLLVDHAPLDHGELAVRFKTISPEGEQVAGIVFRYQDPANYYLVRASSHDDNCVLIRVKKGNKKELDSKDIIISPLAWHELRISFVENKITAMIDSDLVLGTKDSGLRGPGQVGLWTVSDTPATFKEFSVPR